MKREVTMCDIPGCDCSAAGQCALCERDVCTREHAAQATLGAQGDDGSYPAMPLPILICKPCGSGFITGSEPKLLPNGRAADSTAKYVVDEWPNDSAERFKPILEVIRAALAKHALDKKPKTMFEGAKGAQGMTGPVGFSGGTLNGTRYTLKKGDVLVRNKKTGATGPVTYAPVIELSIAAGEIEVVDWGLTAP